MASKKSVLTVRCTARLNKERTSCLSCNFFSGFIFPILPFPPNIRSYSRKNMTMLCDYYRALLTIKTIIQNQKHFNPKLPWKRKEEREKRTHRAISYNVICWALEDYIHITADAYNTIQLSYILLYYNYPHVNNKRAMINFMDRKYLLILSTLISIAFCKYTDTMIIQ